MDTPSQAEIHNFFYTASMFVNELCKRLWAKTTICYNNIMCLMCTMHL